MSRMEADDARPGPVPICTVLAIALFVSLASCSGAGGDTPSAPPDPRGPLHVPGDYRRIGDALAAAAPGCTIMVGPGVYSGPGNWSLEVRTPGIRIMGSPDPEETIIDCSEEPTGNSGMLVRSLPWLVGRNTFELHRVTIRGGRCRAGGALRIMGTSFMVDSCAFLGSSSDSGGALLIDGSVGKLLCCDFRGNRASKVGGAMLMRDAHVDQGLCSFSANDAPRGSAAAVMASVLRSSSCRIVGNGTQAGGGSAVSCDHSVVDFFGDLVAKNEATSDGAGMELSGASYVNMLLMTISENHGNQRGGGILVGRGSSARMRRCIVALNCAEDASDVQIDGGAELYTECTYLDSAGVAGDGIWDCVAPASLGPLDFTQTSGCGSEGESNYVLLPNSPYRHVAGCGGGRIGSEE